jgi:hypothetical protein
VIDLIFSNYLQRTIVPVKAETNGKGYMKVSFRQGRQLLGLIARSKIEFKECQELLKSGRLTELLLEFRCAKREPTITPFCVVVDYGRKLNESCDSCGCLGGNVFQEKNLRVESRWKGKCMRDLFLVCFHREISDDEDSAKSELLKELDKLGLQSEGAAELCAVGKQHPYLQQQFTIVARQQGWELSGNTRGYPVLGMCAGSRILSLEKANIWSSTSRFLASRKRK